MGAGTTKLRTKYSEKSDDSMTFTLPLRCSETFSTKTEIKAVAVVSAKYNQSCTHTVQFRQMTSNDMKHKLPMFVS